MNVDFQIWLNRHLTSDTHQKYQDKMMNRLKCKNLNEFYEIYFGINIKPDIRVEAGEEPHAKRLEDILNVKKYTSNQFIENFGVKCKSLREAYNKLNREKSQLLMKISQLEAIIIDKDIKIDLCQKEFKVKNKKLAQFKENQREIIKLKNALKILEENNSRLKKEQLKSKEIINSMTEKLKEAKILKFYNEQLKENTQNLSEENNALREEIKANLAKSKEFVKLNENLKETFQKQTVKIHSLNQDLNEFIMHNDLKRKNGSIERLNYKLRSFKNKYENLLKELNKIKEDRDAIKIYNLKLKEQLQIAKAKKIRLENEAHFKQMKYKNFKKTVISDYKKLRDNNFILKDECKRLKGF